MFRCVARSLRVSFLFALCLPAAAGTSPDAEDEPDPKHAKLEDIASADTMIMVPMRDGTGLATDVPEREGNHAYTYDPMNPVPALGGGVCCNDDAALGGSYDQRAIEARADVLVYTSEPPTSDVEVTGSIRPILFVSSTARDTDFTVKLVDVLQCGLLHHTFEEKVS